MVRTHSVCLDTHAVVWIVGGQSEKIGAEARSLIEQSELLISPAVTLELQFLYEIGRVRLTAVEALKVVQRGMQLRVADDPFERVVEAALGESWTRDPFDRLIVAHARMLGVPLLSRDRRIAAAFDQTLW
jgi:PIN domain nuclease of toxin-antitoxin system